MNSIFSIDEENIIRVLVLGIASYFILIFFLRISGKRTLSKMNAFDFVVTVSLGSTLASIILSEQITLAQGSVALGLLVALQFGVTWMSVRWGWVRRFMTGEPLLLFENGDFSVKALRHARVSKSEILAAIRSSGQGVLSEVDAVVLETDGSFSVIPHVGEAGNSSLDGVQRRL